MNTVFSHSGYGRPETGSDILPAGYEEQGGGSMEDEQIRRDPEPEEPVPDRDEPHPWITQFEESCGIDETVLFSLDEMRLA